MNNIEFYNLLKSYDEFEGINNETLENKIDISEYFKFYFNSIERVDKSFSYTQVSDDIYFDRSLDSKYVDIKKIVDLNGNIYNVLDCKDITTTMMTRARIGWNNYSDNMAEVTIKHTHLKLDKQIPVLTRIKII